MSHTANADGHHDALCPKRRADLAERAAPGQFQRGLRERLASVCSGGRETPAGGQRGLRVHGLFEDRREVGCASALRGTLGRRTRTGCAPVRAGWGSAFDRCRSRAMTRIGIVVHNDDSHTYKWAPMGPGYVAGAMIDPKKYPSDIELDIVVDGGHSIRAHPGAGDRYRAGIRDGRWDLRERMVVLV